MNENSRVAAIERAEAFLKSLIAETKSQRRIDNYVKLAEVLRRRVACRDKNFHIASIAADSARAGGPSEQTIRNAPGVHFRDLISAFAAVDGATTLARVPRRDYQQELAKRVAAAIPDAQLRAEVLLELAEKRSFKRQIDLLRASTSKGMVIRLAAPGDHETRLKTRDGGDLALTEVEHGALEAFIDPRNLHDNGWLASADGRIVTEPGREIAKVGFLSGIRKILAAD